MNEVAVIGRTAGGRYDDVGVLGSDAVDPFCAFAAEFVRLERVARDDADDLVVGAVDG